MFSLRQCLRDIANMAKAMGDVVIEELVWTNPKPSASFGSQTIALNFDSSDEVTVMFSVDSSASVNNYSSVTIPVGKSGRGYVTTIANNHRNFATSTTGIAFSACTRTEFSGTQVTNNNILIPQRIYRRRKISLWGG